MVRRCVVNERPSWREKNASVGFDYDIVEGVPYWSEDVCYELPLAKVEVLEAATDELHERCLELVDKTISENWFHRLQILPGWARSSLAPGNATIFSVWPVRFGV